MPPGLGGFRSATAGGSTRRGVTEGSCAERETRGPRYPGTRPTAQGPGEKGRRALHISGLQGGSETALPGALGTHPSRPRGNLSPSQPGSRLSSQGPPADAPRRSVKRAPGAGRRCRARRPRAGRWSDRRPGRERGAEIRAPRLPSPHPRQTQLAHRPKRLPARQVTVLKATQGPRWAGGGGESSGGGSPKYPAGRAQGGQDHPRRRRRSRVRRAADFVLPPRPRDPDALITVGTARPEACGPPDLVTVDLPY